MCGIRCSRIKLRTSSCHNDCGVNQCKECNALAVISLIIYLITYPFEPQHLIKSLSLVVKNAQLTSDAKKKNNFPALFASLAIASFVRSFSRLRSLKYRFAHSLAPPGGTTGSIAIAMSVSGQAIWFVCFSSSRPLFLIADLLYFYL